MACQLDAAKLTNSIRQKRKLSLSFSVVVVVRQACLNHFLFGVYYSTTTTAAATSTNETNERRVEKHFSVRIAVMHRILISSFVPQNEAY